MKGFVFIFLVLYRATAVETGVDLDTNLNLSPDSIWLPRNDGPAASHDSVAMTEVSEPVQNLCQHDPNCLLESRSDGRLPRAMTSVERNLDKWLQVEDYRTHVQGTCLLPTKALSTNSSHFHSLDSFLLRNPNVSSIIDLSSEANNYEISDRFPHVRLLKLSLISKVIPSIEKVREFIRLVEDNLSSDKDNGIIAVHCHYGFNRTGFMVCSYLCEVLGLSPGEAIDRYRNARPPGIKHEHFIEELYRRYSKP